MNRIEKGVNPNNMFEYVKKNEFKTKELENKTSDFDNLLKEKIKNIKIENNVLTI